MNRVEFAIHLNSMKEKTAPAPTETVRNQSEDRSLFSQKYCIIFGQPVQAELLFCFGCYFYTIT